MTCTLIQQPRSNFLTAIGWIDDLGMIFWFFDILVRISNGILIQKEILVSCYSAWTY